MPRLSIVSLALLASLLWPASALAQEVPDLGVLAGFIRWGGLFFSVFVVAGSLVLLRVIGTLAEPVGA